MTNKFTPAPWDFLPMGDTLSLVGNNGNRVIAELPSLSKFEGIAFTPSEEDEANYRLIHAAPELFNALEIAKATIERLAVNHGPFNSGQGTVDVIDKALQKARGE